MEDLGPDAALKVGLLTTTLEGNPTGCGKSMIGLIRALCHADFGITVVPLAMGSLGVLEDDDRVRGLVPRDPVVRRWLSMAHAASRGVGHRLSFVTAGSAAAAAAAHRLELDVVHDLTSLGAFATPAQGFRRVLTIYDLISFTHPGTNDRIDDIIHLRWLPRVAPRMDALMLPSATTQEDAVRHLGVPSPRAHVNHLGVDEHYRPQRSADVQRVLARHGLTPGYILFVGSSVPRKNLPRLLEACRLLWRSDCNVQLVIAGPGGAARPTGFEPEAAAHRIAWLGYVPESDLPALYAGAGVLAYPSLYEGFGLPPIEAMRCGAPVVAARAGSLPEVVGDAALLVNPTDVNELARALRAVLRDPATRDRLVQRGAERASEFTWPATAGRAATIYRAVVSGGTTPDAG